MSDQYDTAASSRDGTAGTGDSIQRWNIGRDAVAALLLLVSLCLPWNVYFGVGVPDSAGWMFALLLVISALSAGAIVSTYAGARSVLGTQFDAARSAKLRLALNAPYLMLVLGFAAFTIIQALRYAGSGAVPPGIGPGTLFGLAGALLCAQPAMTGASADDARLYSWEIWTRRVAVAAMVLAVASTVFNLYWRTQYMYDYYTLTKTEVSVIVLAVVYAAVALAAVVIGCRWILRDVDASRLAVVALGTSSLIAGVVVWILGVGREIDAFHGIAESTSTAMVGYEGYLAWVMAAAIVGPVTLRVVATTQPIDKALLRAASQKVLTLIAFWCFASIALRVTDFLVAVSLGLHYSPYDITALIGFDGVAAILATWLRLNLSNHTLPDKAVSAMCGTLFAFTVARLVIGVALAPRVVYVNGAPPSNPVYGNSLAQQITTTFDVVICGLALCVLAAAIVVGQLDTLLDARRRPITKATNEEGGPELWAPTPAAVTTNLVTAAATTQLAAPAAQPRIFRDAEPATQQFAAAMRAGSDSTQQLSTATPQIFRSEHDSTERPADATTQIPTGADKVQRLLDESTQRFAAGTTYTGPKTPPHQ